MQGNNHKSCLQCCGYRQVGKKWSKISLTMLLGGKSLKIIDLLDNEFMPICRLKDILLIGGCTFVPGSYGS